MRYNKNKGSIRLLSAALCAAAAAFMAAGAAECASDGVCPFISGGGIVKGLAQISAQLAVPVINIPLPQESTEDGGQESADEQSETALSQSGKPVTTDPQPAAAPQTTRPPTDTETDDSGFSAPDSVGDETLVSVEEYVRPASNLISRNISTEPDDTGGFTDDDGVIEERTFGKAEGERAVGLEYGQIMNNTDISSSEIAALVSALPDIRIETDAAPQVLIIHTHTAEGYEPDYDDGYYDSDYTGRSLCPAKSVVGVGAILAQRLADNGICTVHDGTVFDDPQYSGSYARSRERIKEILEEYPSIKLVLDIHRDAVSDGDVRVAPTVTVNGRSAAQIMMICGCDDGSGLLPDCMENLKFAAYLQSSIEKDTPGLTRPLLFDYRFYNQDLAAASLLIEVGALGNSAAQAGYAAQLLGDDIARALLALE